MHGCPPTHALPFLHNYTSTAAHLTLTQADWPHGCDSRHWSTPHGLWELGNAHRSPTTVPTNWNELVGSSNNNRQINWWEINLWPIPVWRCTHYSCTLYDFDCALNCGDAIWCATVFTVTRDNSVFVEMNFEWPISKWTMPILVCSVCGCCGSFYYRPTNDYFDSHSPKCWTLKYAYGGAHPCIWTAD